MLGREPIRVADVWPQLTRLGLGVCLVGLMACSAEKDPTDDQPGTSSSSSSSSSSQSSSTPPVVQINEAAALNESFDDEDGDQPDWIELVNTSAQTVSLAGWAISDKYELASAWLFPDLEMAAGEILRIWASDKNRSAASTYRSVLAEGDEVRYLVPDETTAVDWMATDFDDSNWMSGASGFGFGDGDDATELSASSSAVFIRAEFILEDPQQLTGLLLHMDYDDGFVAYLNGVEVARANMAESHPGYDALATNASEATLYQNGPVQSFPVANAAELLNSGRNILAVQVHNVSQDSSDLTAIPFLTGQMSGGAAIGSAPDARLGLDLAQTALHTDFKLSSDGETVYLFDSNGNLVDDLPMPEVPREISVGRSADRRQIVFYDDPTPGVANATAEYLGMVTSEVSFSHSGGVLSPAAVSLSGADEGEVVRYTLDGSVPHQDSPIFQNPISLEEDTVIRARIYRDGYIPSVVDSRTYLANRQHDLPIVTLTIDPLEFFDMETGIYAFGTNYEPRLPHYGANFWQDWERKIEVAYYEPDGQLGFAMDAGVKVFGGWSRANAQRSLSLFARGKYGYGKIEYPLFENRGYDEFEAVVLRNSGNDWMNTMLRDVLMTSLMDGADLEYADNQPVAVYLNNEYWGLYNLREKINEDFLASIADVDADEVNQLEGNAAVIEGTNQSYLEIVDYLEANSLAEDAAFDWVAERVDVENFAIYQIAQIYFGNTDWPGNNIKFWQAPGTKWRWILYDTDFGFGMYEDTQHDVDSLGQALAERGPAYPNPPWSTLMLRKLLENEAFRVYFLNRFADEINSRFHPTRVIGLLDSLAARVASEIPRQIARWEPEMNRDEEEEEEGPIDWEENLEVIREFAQLRPETMRDYIVEYFGLTGSFAVNVNNGNTPGGFVRVNHLVVDQDQWQGHYFGGVPVPVTAVALPGFDFSHWEQEELGSDASLVLNLDADVELTPVFVAREPEM